MPLIPLQAHIKAALFASLFKNRQTERCGRRTKNNYKDIYDDSVSKIKNFNMLLIVIKKKSKNKVRFHCLRPLTNNTMY